MNIIILPGNSKVYNEEWLNEWEAKLKDTFVKTYKHIYEHWKNGGEMIDYTAESVKLGLEQEEVGGELIIFAKSAGTITTVKAVVEGKVSPAKCIFVGCPWKNIEEEIGNNGNISKYKIPTLFIQQTDDMFFKYAELEKFLEEHEIGDYELVEIPGNNHAYDEYNEIKEMIVNFIND